MAFKGHRLQGYCLLTVTENSDGTTTEALGTGKLTGHVVSFNGTKGTDSSDLWAGDVKDFEAAAQEGTVQFVLSQLSLEDEAAYGGHTYTEKEGLVEKEGDVPPYLRYAALGVGERHNEKTGKTEQFFRVLMYHKVKMGPVDDVIQTKQRNVSWQTHSCAGTCYYNEEGLMRVKKDFDTFDAARKAMCEFLNITTE